MANKEPEFLFVLDFEANCSSSGTRDHEIIEFPCICVSVAERRTIDEFRTFVKLTQAGRISKFIKELTHITDEDLAQGMEWQEALDAFETWVFDSHPDVARDFSNAVILCCGSWDIATMLPRQLAITNTVLTPRLELVFGRWNNIKKGFVKAFGARNKYRQCGMDKMLKILNLELVGHHHSGIDDCRNITKIALEVGKAGETLRANCLHEKPYYYNNALAYYRQKNGSIAPTGAVTVPQGTE